MRAGFDGVIPSTRTTGYQAEHGRRPPYWTLVALARASA
jgi:hypothetical protein